MSGLRVVIVGERAPREPGGLAVATERIAEQAAARGDCVHLVTWSKQAPAGGHVVRPPRTLGAGTLVEHAIGRLPDPEQSLLALTEHASQVVREEDAELAHGMYAVRAGYAAVLAAHYHGRPALVSLRGNDLDRGLFRADELPFLSSALTRAERVSAVTRELVHKAQAVFGRVVEYVPNSVDAAAFAPRARDNSLVRSLGLGDAQVIGFFGELREKKGMRFLLPAFAELIRRRPAHLLLVGGVRAEAEPAFDVFKASAPQASARVHVLEYARKPERLSALLALCDLVVFPSLQEGMPNALLEAMAAERAILATEVGGHRDLIEPGVSGALLPLSDLDRLPDAMQEMLELEPERRRELGRRARERVLEAHRPESESAAYARLYAELAGRETSSAR